jgi:hypothetical protein
VKPEPISDPEPISGPESISGPEPISGPESISGFVKFYAGLHTIKVQRFGIVQTHTFSSYHQKYITYSRHGIPEKLTTTR